MTSSRRREPRASTSPVYSGDSEFTATWDFRNDEGKVKHRTIATLARLDTLGEELNAVVDGLTRDTRNRCSLQRFTSVPINRGPLRA